jgi:hypothetical protein
LGEEKSKVLLDNDRVRVLELRLAPGEGEAMHSHPEYLVYVLSPATMRMTGADGSMKVVSLRAGARRHLSMPRGGGRGTARRPAAVVMPRDI